MTGREQTGLLINIKIVQVLLRAFTCPVRNNFSQGLNIRGGFGSGIRVRAFYGLFVRSAFKRRNEKASMHRARDARVVGPDGHLGQELDVAVLLSGACRGHVGGMSGSFL